NSSCGCWRPNSNRLGRTRQSNWRGRYSDLYDLWQWLSQQFTTYLDASNIDNAASSSISICHAHAQYYHTRQYGYQKGNQESSHAISVLESSSGSESPR